MTFPLSKRAEQFTPGPHVVIEPMDPLVQEAVQDIRKVDPNFFAQVQKVVIHFGGGGGHLGFVERGQGKDPRVIHLYKDRIRDIIQKEMGGGLNAKNFKKSVKLALVEVLGHEKTHIGEKPEVEFSGEPEAESGAKSLVDRLKPTMMVEDVLLNASLDLLNIKQKFLPNVVMSEPNLPFAIYSVNKDRRRMIKEGLNILRSSEVNPAIIDIENAIKFNDEIVKRKIKLLGSILNALRANRYDNHDFIIKLAKFQYGNGMVPTGRLDVKTVNKFARSLNFNDFPRNFGIVIPGELYRGGLIDDLRQLKALKDSCGIERVVSLHDSPSIPMMCDMLGIEHVPAYLKSGQPEEMGRKVFGNSISSLLSQKPTYVHCYFGRDRTGSVIARYRTEMGWPCRLAYLEAKSYGFQDIFADFIDWFCEPSDDETPINTEKIRKMLRNKDPYQNPEIIQELLEPTPNDMPFGNPYDTVDSHQYVTWSDTMNNITPTSITSPIPSGSHGK